MRKIVFVLMAILAMTSVTYAVTFDAIENPEPGVGLKSFTVQATGTGINTLGKFTITGNLNQTDDEWSYVTPNLATDSYVMFGELRLPDVAGGTWTGGGSPPDFITTETGSGLTGTLNNYDAINYTPPSWDDYLDLGTPSTTDVTVDLLHIVLGTGETVTVDLSVWTATGVDFLTITEEIGQVIIDAPLDGDANSDGYVGLVDLDRLSTNWGTTSGATWAQADFNGDGAVSLVDLDRMSSHWNEYAEWYAPPEGSPVPEPSTIVMLVLGALCLAGYRLRK